jgi:hypothetical protein
MLVCRTSYLTTAIVCHLSYSSLNIKVFGSLYSTLTAHPSDVEEIRNLAISPNSKSESIITQRSVHLHPFKLGRPCFSMHNPMHIRFSNQLESIYRVLGNRSEDIRHRRSLDDMYLISWLHALDA